MSKTNEQIAMPVLWGTLIGNILLTAFKLFAGFFANSAAMVSDAVHSLSDVVAELIVMAGIKLSNQKSDKEHPYGHERIECVAGVILAFILFLVGGLIGWSGLRKTMSGNYGDLAVPGVLALIAAVVSIVVKEVMYWYAILAAKKINSVSLKASAWHHRSDALSSVGSFAGIFGARSGFPILDSVASIVISVFIIKVAFSIFKESMDKMIDTSCADSVVDEMRNIVLAQDSVLTVDKMATRLFGDKIYVDVEIGVDGCATLNAAHDVAQRVQDAVEAEFPNIKHCMVHMNPYAREDHKTVGA